MSYKEGYHNEFPVILRDDGKVIDNFVDELNSQAKELEAKDKKIEEQAKRNIRISNALVKHLHEEDSYIDEIEAKDKLIADLKEKLNGKKCQHPRYLRVIDLMGVETCNGCGACWGLTTKEAG